MLFYYIRHADPIYDPDSLTEEGHRQAQALAERFKLRPFDEVYCSVSMRARMTAEPTCKAIGKEPVLCDWAYENHAGEYFVARWENGRQTWSFVEPRTRRQFNSPEVLALGDNWANSPLFKNTKYADGIAFVNENVDGFFKALGYEHDRTNHYYTTPLEEDNRRIALFAHESIGLSILSSLLDIPYPIFSTHFGIEHSGVTVIDFSKRSDNVIFPCVLQHSNDSHLFKADLSTKYNHTYDI